MRNGAYRAFQIHLDNLTDGKLTGLLPECIVDWVQEMFPSPAGVYHGWPWDAQELISMGFEPSEYLREQDIAVDEHIQLIEAKKRNAEAK